MRIYLLSVMSIPEINPNIIRDHSLFDIVSIFSEIWMMPGNYLAWLLSAVSALPATDGGILSFLISGVLFLPFCVWPFINSEKYKYSRRILQAATVLMLLLFISAPIYIRSLG